MPNDSQKVNHAISINHARPSLRDLGDDLLDVGLMRRWQTLMMPFIFMAAFALFAWVGWWLTALAAVMALSFVTYGSTSHDLVHSTLKLKPWTNAFFLSLIEGLSLRSGTAYRLSHLHHHAHLLSSSDIEGACAHGGLWNAIATGPTLQIRLWLWAWNGYPRMRRRLAIEAISIFSLMSVACISWIVTPIPLAYVALVIGGSWLFPLVTVYLPHDARVSDPLLKTRLFRGRILQTLACGHLYHLEHHLYPAVPHHHWKRLADRLDPYFEREGISPETIQWGRQSSQQVALKSQIPTSTTSAVTTDTTWVAPPHRLQDSV